MPLAEKIGTDNVGLARFSVSRDGVLAYRTGDSGGRLLWRDRAGRELESVGDPGDYGNPALSPSGDRLAFNLADARSGKSDIWIRDLARGVNSRFSLGPGNNFRPLWSPDGGTIVFTSDRDGTLDLYEKSTQGQGGEKLLLKSDEPKSASSWSSRRALHRLREPEPEVGLGPLGAADLRRPQADSDPRQLRSSRSSPCFRPTGASSRTRRTSPAAARSTSRRFPTAAGKWQVSNSGGTDPSWRGDGKELFYRSPDQKLMAVEIRTAGERLQAGIPQALFPIRIRPGTRAQQVRGFRGRPAVPLRRAARPRVHEPDDGRPELARRPREVDL